MHNKRIESDIICHCVPNNSAHAIRYAKTKGVNKVTLDISKLCIGFTIMTLSVLSTEADARRVVNSNVNKYKRNIEQRNERVRRDRDYKAEVEGIKYVNSIKKDLKSLNIEEINNAILGLNGMSLTYIKMREPNNSTLKMEVSNKYDLFIFNDIRYDFMHGNSMRLSLYEETGHIKKKFNHSLINGANKLSDDIKNSPENMVLFVFHENVFLSKDVPIVPLDVFYIFKKDNAIKIRKRDARCDLSEYKPCESLKNKSKRHKQCEKDKSNLTLINVTEALLSAIAEAFSCQFGKL